MKLTSAPGSGAAGGPPLTGVRVLDFTRFVAGPYATMLLADAGADVVKVEPTGGEETRGLDPMLDSPVGKVSGYFHRFNRSKRSVSIDIGSEAGRALIFRLLPQFDVVVENFRPGVMTSLGLGYDELRGVAPSIIYCSISGYGHTPSPHRDDPAFAVLAEVSAGVVGRTMRPGDPPVRLSAPLGDLFPAALAVAGIGMALWKRERTGLGSHVDMAMFDALLSLNENAIGMSATTGNEVLPSGALTYAAPFGIFKASDGFLCIAVLGEKVWHRFCQALGRPELAEDPELGTGTLRARALKGKLGPVLDSWLASHTRASAVSELVAAGVPAGQVQTPFQIIDSDQTRARHMVWEVPSYSGMSCRLVGSPIRFDESGFAAVRPVPDIGQDTLEVLTSLGGLTEEEVEGLSALAVVRLAEPQNHLIAPTGISP